MIEVKEALQLVEHAINTGPVIELPIEDCLHLILAHDVTAPISMPPFRQSSMDGYALRLSQTNTYTVCGEIQAGQAPTIELQEGEAVRIFTGAPVPDTADTVVMQEHVARQESTILILQRPAPFANVRALGEQLKKGEVALTHKTKLNAAGLGFLAGLGISKVRVYKKPSVTILLTGDELQQPGNRLGTGEIYDSNSVTIKAALQTEGIEDITIEHIPDSYEATRDTIKKHLALSDILFLSGGISVGDYDFVRDALIENDIDEIFYKVNQKPGKPLWFGKKKNTVVFALPGNPASSLSCFYVYGIPALRKLMGHQYIHLPRAKAQMAVNFTNRFGKTLFLKGSVYNGVATPLLGQASSMLSSFAISNALLIIPETTKTLKKGAFITYLDLNS